MMQFDAIENTSYRKTDLHQLLALGLAIPSAAAIDQILSIYYQPQSDARLFIAKYNNILVGVIGIQLSAKGTATIQHLAVRPDVQWKGVGRFMLTQLGESLGLNAAEADTDIDRVGFFKSCGFLVRAYAAESLENERYHCLISFED